MTELLKSFHVIDIFSVLALVVVASSNVKISREINFSLVKNRQMIGLLI